MFYYGTPREFKPGKTYKVHGATGIFGQYENFLDRYKPRNEVSRLQAFYLAISKAICSSYGNHIYLVEPIGNCSICAFGWISIMIALIPPICYKKESGYVLPKLDRGSLSLVKDLVQKYYTGRIPEKSDFANYGVDYAYYANTSRVKLIEVLTPEIRIVKKFGGL